MNDDFEPPGEDEGCIGNDSGEQYENGEDPCTHPIAFLVHGDFACVHHLVRVVRMRCADVRDGKIEVLVYDGPQPPRVTGKAT